jgi:hypothetical protein
MKQVVTAILCLPFVLLYAVIVGVLACISTVCERLGLTDDFSTH